MDYTASFYSKPSYIGGGIVFSGARRQKGGNILGSLKTIVLPVLKSVGRKFSRIASKQALGLASGIVADAIAGKNVKQSLINRGKHTLLDTANEGLSSLNNLFATSPDNKRPRRTTKKKTSRASTASNTAAGRRGRSNQRGSGKKGGGRGGKKNKKTRSRSNRRQAGAPLTNSSRKRRYPSRNSNSKATKRRRIKNF